MRSIRWKIITVCAAVILIPLLLLNRYTIRTFDRFSSRNLEEQMKDIAFIAGEHFKLALDSAGNPDENIRPRFEAAMRAYSAEVQARIQVLSSNGMVYTDSSQGASAGTDLTGLREVSEALQGRYSARCALTDDRRFMYYFVARPVKTDGQVRGVIYVSRTTSDIVRILNNVIRVQRATTASAIAGAMLLSAVLAYTITSRLRKLTAATTAFARGNPGLDVRVKGHDEVADLASAIHMMADEIKRTNTYNREFISTVIHELKMPITAIKGAAELLEQGAAAKETARQKFLGNIRLEADRMTRLVQELTELTKLDMEIPHSQKEKTDYCQCIREIVDRFETTLDPGHAPIKLSLPEKNLQAMILPGRIEQVLCNLLGNAVRYTPASGTIEVSVQEGPARTIVTSVRDTGCGITPSNLPKIFNRFFTTEPKDRPRDYGSGLGLAIAKSIVESHHGRIWVESVPEQGATFFFSLPAVS